MGGCFSDVSNTREAVGGQRVHDALQAKSSAQQGALDAAMLITGGAECTSRVVVHVSCSTLKKSDVLSKSDPMAVLFEIQPNGAEKEIGRTEMIANNQSPTFVTGIKVNFNFEKVQKLRLLVVDIDSGQDPATVNPTRCDFLGDLMFTMGELVTAKDQKFTKPLDTRSAHVSRVSLACEELSTSKDEITMVLAGVKLRNIEVFSRSDPFVEICKAGQGDAGMTTWQPVFKSEVKPDCLNPVWRAITVPANQLNNGDMHRPLLLKVFDHEVAGEPRLLGQVETTAVALESACQTGAPLALALPGKPQVDCGQLVVKSYQVVRKHTFLDYIKAGAEISFIVGVDWTASNRPPTDPYSLHYLNPNGALTPYEQALLGVGRVLEFYDSDRQYPAFGFGGQLGNAPVSHCFPLSGQPDAVCAGVQGIVQAYRTALSMWRLSGPTLFAPLIHQAAQIAAQPSPHLRYSVLLILTDGAILDMPATVDAICGAANLPMSILIVGVGNGPFGEMQTLDGDERRLRDGRGVPASRDIVQFVELNRYQHPDALVAELLAELPGQFLEYVRSRNIPLPAVPATPAT